MSLTMTGEEFYEAYGDAGMDSDDRAAWELAVDRARTPEDECEHRNASATYCPDCGYDAEQAAEIAAGC